MTSSSVLLWLCSLALLSAVTAAAAAAAPPRDHRVLCHPSNVPAVARTSCLDRLRGGADEDDLEEDDVGEEVDDVAAGAELSEAAENPFLGMPGAGGGGLGLQDLESTLKDPKMLQDALKELQVYATARRFCASYTSPARPHPHPILCSLPLHLTAPFGRCCRIRRCSSR